MTHILDFFHELVREMWPKRDTEEGSETKLIFTSPRNGRHNILHRPLWERQWVGQEAEDKSKEKALGHSLY